MATISKCIFLFNDILLKLLPCKVTFPTSVQRKRWWLGVLITHLRYENVDNWSPYNPFEIWKCCVRVSPGVSVWMIMSCITQTVVCVTGCHQMCWGNHPQCQQLTRVNSSPLGRNGWKITHDNSLVQFCEWKLVSYHIFFCWALTYIYSFSPGQNGWKNTQ